MRFWVREITGWLLLLLGLLIFYSCFVMLVNERPPRLLEAAPLTLIGIVIFRGGIQLLRVAVAARVCLQAQQQIDRGVGPTGPIVPKRQSSWVPPSRRVC